MAALIGTDVPARQQTQVEALAPLLACQQERDGERRLRCFDQAVTQLTQATQTGDVVIVDRESIRRTRRSLFGFLLPRNPLLDGGSRTEPEVKEIAAKIMTARPVGSGRWRFQLEDSGTWQTEESSSAIFNPKPGTSVQIRRGALGGYFLTVQGRTVRAARVQ
jgi:hypothetical protein